MELVTQSIVKGNKPGLMPQVKSARLLSLDALRGFDMFWIICGEGIFHGFANVVMAKHALVRNPDNFMIVSDGHLSLIERMAVGMSNQLHHTVWNGFTFYDMIFPLFIFIAGVSMPFSFAKYLEEMDPAVKDSTKWHIYRSLIKRTILLIALGMVVNGVLQWQGYANTRFASVLGRIGLSCFFAAIIYMNCSLRMQIIWFATLLLGYWAAMMLIPVPGFGAGVLTPEGNLAAYIDRILLPGRLHRKIYDPEGLLSTIPAIGSALLGVFAGQLLKWPSQKWTKMNKGLVLFSAGIGLVLLGLIWDLLFPINKNMWTSSFVLFAGGWSVMLFAIFYLVIDGAGFRKWSMPFVWIGTNSILIYLAAHGLVNFQSSSQFLFGGIINQVTGGWKEVLLWTGVLIIQLAVLYLLFRKNWFWKI